MAVKSIMIVGVGGQGTLLASRLLGSALIDSGYEVKVSEIHGMSQRGGSVVTYVKYGDEVFSPTIEQGEADIILAFEKLEAARWLSFLKPEGKLVVNDQCIDPMPVITGAAEYPQNTSEAIKAAGASMIELDALSLADPFRQTLLCKTECSHSIFLRFLSVLRSVLRADNRATLSQFQG